MGLLSRRVTVLINTCTALGLINLCVSIPLAELNATQNSIHVAASILFFDLAEGSHVEGLGGGYSNC